MAVWIISPPVTAGTVDFGQTTPLTSASSQFTSIRGARFTCTTSGSVSSISAYLSYAPSEVLGNINTGSTNNNIENIIRGRTITTPSSQIVVTNISAHIQCTTAAKNMRAAIYTTGGNLVAQSAEMSVPSSPSGTWRTFTFASPPTLAASTTYVIVVWSGSGNGEAYLRSSGTSTNIGRSVTSTYGGSFPSSVSFTTDNVNYCIYANYYTLCSCTMRNIFRQWCLAAGRH